MIQYNLKNSGIKALGRIIFIIMTEWGTCERKKVEKSNII